jgi:hypothetical protein
MVSCSSANLTRTANRNSSPGLNVSSFPSVTPDNVAFEVPTPFGATVPIGDKLNEDFNRLTTRGAGGAHLGDAVYAAIEAHRIAAASYEAADREHFKALSPLQAAAIELCNGDRMAAEEW